MNHTVWFFLSVILAALPVLSCQPPGKQGKKKKIAVEKIPVRVERLKKRPYLRKAAAVSTVEAWRTVKLRAEAAGRVLTIRKEVGQRCQANELLVRLDGALAWRAYRTAGVGIKQARTALAMAKINLDRARRLHASGDLPKARLDQAQNAFDQAKNALQMAQARSSQAGQRLGQFWVRAPFAGVVAERPIHVGDYVGPGSAVLTLVEMDRVKVVVGVQPEDAVSIEAGAPAEVMINTVRGAKQRPARIHLIRPLADPRTRRIIIELVVKNADHSLKPGMIARARIPLGKPRPLALTQNHAVVKLMQRYYVYVVREGKAVRLPVRLGVSTRDRVELLPVPGTPPARRFQLGDQIVVEGHQRLYPGAPVNVVLGHQNGVTRAR